MKLFMLRPCAAKAFLGAKVRKVDGVNLEFDASRAAQRAVVGTCWGGTELGSHSAAWWWKFKG